MAVTVHFDSELSNFKSDSAAPIPRERERQISGTTL
jgi:hypothetical protein